MTKRAICLILTVLCIFLLPLPTWASGWFANQIALWSNDETVGFGQQVALGTDTLAVMDNTPCINNPSDYCGSAFVYQKLLGAWTEVAHLSVSASYSVYVSKLAISSDGSLIALGAPDSGTNLNGAVYVFQRPSSGWHDISQSATLTIPVSTGSYFGNRVAINGNIIYAAYDNFCGGVYYPACIRIASYKQPAAGWTDSSTPTATLSYSGEGGNVSMGGQIGASGNYVISNLVDSLYPENGENLLVFPEPAGGWVDSNESDTITPPSGFAGTNSGFGSKISLAGTTLAVPATNGSFMVLVYQEPVAGWQSMSPTGSLTPPALVNASFDLFDNSQNWVGVGGTSPTTSLVYLFQKPLTGWADSNIPDQTLNIPVTSVAGSGARAFALTDDVAAVGSEDQTCPSGLTAASNSCSVVYLYDSSAIVATADMEMQMALQGKFAVADTTETINISIKNSGSAAADDLQISGKIPAQLNQAATKSSQGSCQLVNNSLTCNLGSLSAGVTATVNLTAIAPKTAQTITQSMTWSTSSAVRSLRHDKISVSYYVDSPPTSASVTLTTPSGIGIQGSFAGKDTSGLPLTYQVLNSPSHGQVSTANIPDGRFLYTPNAGFVGTDSFTYVANDGYTNSGPATVTITVQALQNSSSNGNNGLSGNPVVRAAAGAFGIYEDSVLLGFFLCVQIIRQRRKSKYELQ